MHQEPFVNNKEHLGLLRYSPPFIELKFRYRRQTNPPPLFVLSPKDPLHVFIHYSVLIPLFILSSHYADVFSVLPSLPIFCLKLCKHFTLHR